MYEQDGAVTISDPTDFGNIVHKLILQPAILSSFAVKNATHKHAGVSFVEQCLLPPSAYCYGPAFFSALNMQYPETGENISASMFIANVAT